MLLDSAWRFLTTCLQILSASSMLHFSMLDPTASYHSAARISQIKWLSKASMFVRSVSSFWRKAMLTKFSKPGSCGVGLEKYSMRGMKFCVLVLVFISGSCCIGFSSISVSP